MMVSASVLCFWCNGGGWVRRPIDTSLYCYFQFWCWAKMLYNMQIVHFVCVFVRSSIRPFVNVAWVQPKC